MKYKFSKKVKIFYNIVSTFSVCLYFYAFYLAGNMQLPIMFILAGMLQSSFYQAGIDSKQGIILPFMSPRGFFEAIIVPILLILLPAYACIKEGVIVNFLDFNLMPYQTTAHLGIVLVLLYKVYHIFKK